MGLQPRRQALGLGALGRQRDGVQRPRRTVPRGGVGVGWCEPLSNRHGLIWLFLVTREPAAVDGRSLQSIRPRIDHFRCHSFA